MSGAVTPSLADNGPLLWMAQALQARLQTVFPPQYFTFAVMPHKADKAWFNRYVPRMPAVLLGWNNSEGKSAGGVWEGVSNWSVALIVENKASPAARLFGDVTQPGLFAMERVAKLVLHGWLVNPASTAWSAQGTAIVNATGNVSNEDWGRDDIAICVLDVSIPYEETLPPGIGPDPAASLQLVNLWNFGEQPPLFSDQSGVV